MINFTIVNQQDADEFLQYLKTLRPVQKYKMCLKVIQDHKVKALLLKNSFQYFVETNRYMADPKFISMIETGVEDWKIENNLDYNYGRKYCARCHAENVNGKCSNY